MRPSFKEKITEILNCKSREQCTGPTEKRRHVFFSFSVQSKPILSVRLGIDEK